MLFAIAELLVNKDTDIEAQRSLRSLSHWLIDWIRRFARGQHDVVCWRSRPTPGFPVQKTATCLCWLCDRWISCGRFLASFTINSDFMMELYPKAVDFNESWDTLRESTRLMISGEGYLSKDEWNDRIMYPLLFDRWRKTAIKCFISLRYLSQEGWDVINFSELVYS